MGRRLCLPQISRDDSRIIERVDEHRHDGRGWEELRSTASRFGAISKINVVTPATLPPGWLRLVTSRP
jgi:hypothetical protein